MQQPQGGQSLTNSVEHNLKSAQFPAIFKTSAEYHTPGTEITGTAIPHQEVIVTLDDLLISDAFIADIDEAMNHYDVRGPYANELGKSLALTQDKNIARMVIQSARASAIFSGGNGGSTLSNDGYATDATTLISGLNTAKQTLDENDVPVDTQRVNAVLKVAEWYLVANSDKNINRDYNEGQGGLHHQNLRTISDIYILKSNATPYGTDESAAGIPTKYQGDWSLTVGAVYTADAVASLRLMNLQTQMGFDMRRQGTLMIARMAVGHGTLRPDCAVEIATVT